MIAKTTPLNRNLMAPSILLHFYPNFNVDWIISSSSERSGPITNGYLGPYKISLYIGDLFNASLDSGRFGIVFLL